MQPLSIILSIVFGALLAFFATISTILNYHWKQYELHPGKIKKLQRVYGVGAGILCATLTAFYLRIVLP